MARQARRRSSTGIYHIILRGINRQIIFHDREDYARFLETLKKYKEISCYQIYAYCLMSNHVHLLLKVNDDPLEQALRRIGSSYVFWYNAKYDRVGNLFQDRFKSESVESDRYFLTVLRYIHQNPLKAGIAGRIEDYPWSSAGEYMNKPRIIDADFALGLFHDEKSKASKYLYEFSTAINDDQCLEHDESSKITDQEAMDIIMRVCQIDNTLQMQNMDKVKRDKYLTELKGKYRISGRQISRLTGINRGIIFRAGK